MGGEWPLMPLREAGVTLIDCVHQTPVDAGEGYPYIAIPQMKQGRIDFNAKPRLISEVDFFEWTQKANPKENDVVLSRRCNPGETAYVPKDVQFALGQNLVLLRADESRFYPPFLRWIVKGPQWWEQVNKFLNVGAVFDSLRCADVPNFELPIPSLYEQKAIAHILGSLDDKIELNRQMNATLESMAQALFKSWFVDFDPVIDNALAAGNPIPEPFQARAKTRKALGDKRKSLPEAVQQQFPSSFVFTKEMGWVPEGWSPLPLNEAIVINPRVSLKIGSVAKYVDMKALPTSGYTIDEVVEGKVYSGGAKFENGDILLARITPCLENGKTGVVDFLDENVPGFGSTEFIVLRSKGEIKTPFIAALARDEVFRQHCIVNMVGSSGRQRVQNSCFNSYYICRPDEGNILRQYHELCFAKFNKITSLRREIWSLTRLRDTLLPKLLSGQLRIPDAEKIMADAL